MRLALIAPATIVVVVVVVVVVAVVGAAGCGAPVLNPADYDQSCDADEDCVAVAFSGFCNPGCGSPNGAVNRADAQKVADDTTAARGWCPPALPVDCLFGGQVVAVCNDGTCGVEPVVAETAPSFSFGAPLVGVVVPTNFRFVGRIVPGSDGSDVLPATLLVDGEPAPRTPTFTREHCDQVNGCEDVMSFGELPPNTNVTLHFDDLDVGAWTTGEGPDTRAPRVGEISIATQGVSGNQDHHVFKDLTITEEVTLDDVALADTGMFRSIDGGDEVLLERLSDRSGSNRFTDQIDDDSGAQTACYTLAGWDLAGNEARSQQRCLDVTVSKGDHDALSSHCANAGCASWPAAALLAFLFRIRRKTGARPRGARSIPRT